MELPEPENLVGIAHLAALTSAARGARRLGKRSSATLLARLALDTFGRTKDATPALHRPSRSSTEIEMKMILDENGASVSDSVEVNSSDKWRWEKLVRINTRLNSELRISSLLDLIMDTALDVTDAKRGFLLVADSKGVLQVRCARNTVRCAGRVAGVLFAVRFRDRTAVKVSSSMVRIVSARNAIKRRMNSLG